jgi:hypothetical protein
MIRRRNLVTMTLYLELGRAGALWRGILLISWDDRSVLTPVAADPDVTRDEGV